MSSKIEYTIRNSIQELTNQKEQLYNYIDDIEYGIKILSIELPELLEEQFLIIREELRNHANYSLDELTNLRVGLVELQNQLAICCQKESFCFNLLFNINGQMDNIVISIQQIKASKNQLDNDINQIAEQKLIFSSAELENVLNEIQLLVVRKQEVVIALTNIPEIINQIDYRIKGLAISPQELEEKILILRKELGNYVNYSVAELINLRVRLVSLQKELKVNLENAVAILTKYCLEFSVIDNISEKVNNIKISIEQMEKQKEQLANYIDRIDYRIRALATNYNAKELKEIFNYLEQLINSGQILAISEFLENKPIDLNINAPIFINEEIKNCFQKINFHKSLRVLEILINYGFNINIQNKYGESPLFEAVKSKNIPIIELLLDSGANVNIKNKYNNTPLFYAVWDENIAVMELLLDSGADIDICNNDGNYPLHYTVWGKDIRVMQLLLDRDANINIKNRYGETPLFCAVRSENIQWVKLLLDRGAVANIKTKDDETPLFEAVRNRNIPIIKLLLASGANVNIKTNLGYSPLSYAKKWQYIKIISLLTK